MKIGFVFSGYGTQFVGMSKDIYDNYRSMQELFEETAQCLDTNFVKLTFASSDSEIQKIENAYVVLLVTTAALAQILHEYGIVPTVVSGHNVGEYAALVHAKALTLPDALYLLKKYASLFQKSLEKVPCQALRIIGMDKTMVEQLCTEGTRGKEFASIALTYNDQDFVVTGTKKSIEYIYDAANNFSYAKTIAVPVGIGLHSPLLNETSQALRPYLEKVDFKESTINFLTNVLGEPLTAGESVKAALIQHINAPGQWDKLAQQLGSCDVLIEIGPQTPHQPTLAAQTPEQKIYSLVTLKDLKIIVKELTDKDIEPNLIENKKTTT